jgi:polyphosphate kinase
MSYSPGSVRLRDELARRFSLEADDLYEFNGPLNTVDFLELANVAGFEELIEQPWKIQPAADFSEETPVWDRISQGDVMLHFPYQSFDPVVRFFQEAATDPGVIAIKTALYRTGGAIPGTGISSGSSAFSPVVRALEQAALNGKQVTAVVELKARFDEERNISWANRLEKAGVIVVYGLSRLKVHAKITMVLRRENDRIKRYVHLSTGNYNDKTAKHYEDLCLFTCREDIAYDAGLLFNMLTGYSSVQSMLKLTIAPSGLKRRLLDLIERETNRSKQQYPGRIMAKLNSLTDVDIIKALYRASKAGVKISLCVRGICTLIPEIPKVSENIRVISVVDHYLEHSRIYYFANGGAEEIYLSSADWMPRNLERRVELMFPVKDEKIHIELREILNDYFRDNCQASTLDKNGVWARLSPAEGEKPFRIQKEMLSRAARVSENPGPVKPEYIVRRSPATEK